MKAKLPSGHQFGDHVNLSFGDAGIIQNAKITKVSFDPGKVFYDAEIEVKPGMTTRLRQIDSAFVEKVIYSEAFKFASSRSWDNVKTFKAGTEYSLFDEKAGTDSYVGKIIYKGYNARHKALIFDCPYKLKGTEYDLRYEEDRACSSFSVDRINQDGFKIMLPDEENSPEGYFEKTPMTESEFERLPLFSIRDIDKIFDEERRNHGTNPVDSINRMYRKLLALKDGIYKQEIKSAIPAG